MSSLPSKLPFVSIIVPTYNGRKKIGRCLRSLQNINYQKYEIIAVDDCSEDGTPDYINKYFSRIKLILLSKNSGVAHARNEGMKKASGKYYCFVDDDNTVDPNFLMELVQTAESDRTIGFVGPKMLFYNNPKKIMFAGSKINLLTSRTRYLGINETDRGQYDQAKETDHIPNVWLVKRHVIDMIGVIDERYITHYEESDWALRAKVAGFKIVYCPKSVVYHDVPIPNNTSENIMLIRGNSSRQYYYSRNRIIFMKKFAPRLNYYAFLLFFNNIFLLIHLIIFIKSRRFDVVSSYLSGFFGGLKQSIKVQRIAKP